MLKRGMYTVIIDENTITIWNFMEMLFLLLYVSDFSQPSKTKFRIANLGWRNIFPELNLVVLWGKIPKVHILS